jgi:hypothetical protein
VATVELDGVSPSTEDAREALSAQVVWTLRQLPEVRDIRIRVGGRPLEAGSAAEVLDRDAWPQYDPAVLASDAEAYALRANRLGELDGAGHQPLPNAAGTGDRPLSQFAVSIDRSMLAGLWANRLYVGPLDGSQPMAAVSAVRGRLAEPSFDRLGTLWVFEQSTGSAYAIGLRNGAPRRLLTPGTDAPVTALRVARDGVRVALLTQAGRKTSLWVGVINRSTGADFVAESLRVVSTYREPLVDLAWQDHKRLVLLPSEQGGSPHVTDIAGFDEDLLPPLPVGARSITAGPGLALPALVGTERGSILRLDPRRWSPEFAGSEPSYPG